MNKYRLYRFLISIIYPNRCPLCGVVISHDEYFCSACGPDLTDVIKIDGVIACCEYSAAAKKMVLSAKEQKDGYSAAACAALLYNALSRAGVLSDIDLVTFIPTRKSRLKEKGYCLPRLMAKDIAALSGKKFLSLLNVRDYQTSQKMLGEAERAENLKGVFYPAAHIPAGSRILLIDDVSTTGSTLFEAANTLTQNGADLVIPAAYAKTRKTRGLSIDN